MKVTFRDHEVSRMVGQRIRQAREDKGLSQAELAKEIHRLQSSLSAMETGKVDADATTLMYLAIVLRKPISYFFPILPGFGIIEGQNEDEQELIKTYRGILGEKYQRLALRLVHTASTIELEEEFDGNPQYKEIAWYDLLDQAEQEDLIPPETD